MGIDFDDQTVDVSGVSRPRGARRHGGRSRSAAAGSASSA